ncbi:GNAT family N-acetyltransferase [Actinosynnema sp. NPDC023658]|uniref:GNAT family N-acetyltransferase n=1 Tax=Actinosynnema sp. NPDC023658 TaxID=3155465 RepID=UPI0033EE61D6
MGYGVRDYVVGDESSWLRCRVLSFLGTAYYDSVVAAKPRVPGVELVAVDGEVVVGIVDVAVDGALASIETISVHPDHQYRGIGGALLSGARARARALGATTLDTWTRDDSPTLRWHRAMGFSESDHYLHVIAEHDGPVSAARAGLDLRVAFLPADPAAGSRSPRVHVHRRFAMPLTPVVRPSGGQLGRRGDDVDHRAVAQDGHRQR